MTEKGELSHDDPGRSVKTSPMAVAHESDVEGWDLTPGVFRRVMSRWVTGVGVLTTLSPSGDCAMTANSLCSVSLTPMLVSCCLQRTARFHEMVMNAGLWGVSMLPESEAPLAQRLAMPGRPAAGQLNGVGVVRGATGVALLDCAVAHLECETVCTVPAGDHTLVIGRVLGLHLPGGPTGQPLTFYEGQFGRVSIPNNSGGTGTCLREGPLGPLRVPQGTCCSNHQ